MVFRGINFHNSLIIMCVHCSGRNGGEGESSLTVRFLRRRQSGRRRGQSCAGLGGLNLFRADALGKVGDFDHDGKITSIIRAKLLNTLDMKYLVYHLKQRRCKALHYTLHPLYNLLHGVPKDLLPPHKVPVIGSPGPLRIGSALLLPFHFLGCQLHQLIGDATVIRHLRIEGDGTLVNKV